MSVQVISLTDSGTGATAKILPGFGFNCFEFVAPHRGQMIPLLWSEPGFETGQKRASGSGNPILFPYPGRIRGQQLAWQGRSYPLEGNDNRGNAIHGFVIARPWRVLELTDSVVVGQFQASVDEPRLRDCWPADFRITARYELAHNALRMQYTVENPDSVPLPCGLGLHPYFRVPLGGRSANECRVELPAAKRWELHEMLPTGRLLPIEDSAGYRAGLKFADMAFDDVFADLTFSGELCTCRVVDPESGCRLAVEFDRAFRECVVYNPPHRQAVCIEPYTCVPNAAELREAGLDTGLRVLAPGERFTGCMIFRVE